MKKNHYKNMKNPVQLEKNNDNHEFYENFTGSASHLARHLKTIRILINHTDKLLIYHESLIIPAIRFTDSESYLARYLIINNNPPVSSRILNNSSNGSFQI